MANSITIKSKNNLHPDYTSFNSLTELKTYLIDLNNKISIRDYIPITFYTNFTEEPFSLGATHTGWFIKLNTNYFAFLCYANNTTIINLDYNNGSWTYQKILNTIIFSSITAASNVTLRNINLRRQFNVISGYIEVKASINSTTLLGTITKSELRPTEKKYFPAWNSSSGDFLGFIDIATNGEITLHPKSGISGSNEIASSVNYIVA